MDEKDKFLDLSKFESLKVIGRGAFSKVFLVKETSTGEICAAKVLKSEINDDTIDSEEILSLLREVKLMSSLNHPSILQFIGFSLYNFRQKPFPTIVTKYATNGSLRDIIKLELSGLSPPCWDPTRKLINIYGIASGLAYLHKHNIIHRDIKPENILMDEYLFPKIADFGLSKITVVVSKSLNIQSQSGFKGTPIYMAPEVLRDEPYTNLVDVYSFSIIVYEILTGITPFQNMILPTIMCNVALQNKRPELTNDIPLPFQNLIEKCWSANPEDRPSFDEIVNQLKTDKDFISDSINENEFLDYIDYIDSYQTSFLINNSFHFKDMIKKRSNTITNFSIQKFDQKKSKTNQKIVEQKVEENENNTSSSIISFKYSSTYMIESFFVDYLDFEESDEEHEDFIEILGNKNVKYTVVFSKKTNQYAICAIINPDILKFDDKNDHVKIQSIILKKCLFFKTI